MKKVSNKIIAEVKKYGYYNTRTYYYSEAWSAEENDYIVIRINIKNHAEGTVDWYNKSNWERVIPRV